jgi:hypothetical protein
MHLVTESQAPNWLDGEMQGGEVDRLISVRQSVTLYTDELGEETNGALCFRPVFI